MVKSNIIIKKNFDSKNSKENAEKKNKCNEKEHEGKNIIHALSNKFNLAAISAKDSQEE